MNACQRFHSLAVAALVLLSSGHALAQEKANEADARKALQQMVDVIKAKGVVAGSDALNKGDECKVKDLSCLVFDLGSKVLAAPRAPALVGQQFPTFTDVDGKDVASLLGDPLRQGKTSWETAYKGTVGGGKAIVMRRSLCARLDANHAACTMFSL